MSYYDNKYRDLDANYDKIMHSTPKKSREEYSSSVSSSYVPRELSKATENHISNIGQSENVSTRGGVTRNVTQSVKKTTSVSSTRSSGYSSEEGRKEDEIGHSDLNARAAIRSSNADDLFTSNKSKQNDIGFQYEDIKSFKDRQKVEGDRLQMHRQSLTGNIVGTGKHGAMMSDYGSHSSSYSSALDSKPKGDDESMFTNRVEEYKYSSDQRGSGDNLLSNSKGDDKVDSKLYSSSSSDYKVSSGRDNARNDALLRAEKLLAEAKSRNNNRPSSSSKEFRYSRELSSSKEDLIGSDNDKVSGSDRVSSRDDPLSRENLLAEARKQSRDAPSSVHSSSSHDFRYSRGLSSSKEDITGSTGSDRGSSRDDPLSRENLLAEARNLQGRDQSGINSSSSQEFRYSRGLSSSKEDITGSSRDDPLSRENLLAEARKQGTDAPSNVHSSSSHDFRYSRGLSSSKEDITGSSRDKVDSSRDDPLSRENLLAEARKQGRDAPSSAHSSSSSHEFRYSRGLSSSNEDITSPNKDRLSSNYRLNSSSSSIDDKLGKVGDPGTPQDERFSRSDALVSKYLHSSRHKGLSKYGVDLESDSKSHHTPLKDIKEEAREDSLKKDFRNDKNKDHTSSEVMHHSAGGKPMSYLSSSTSYEDLLQRKRDAFAGGKGDEDKSDRTKRFSSEIRDERKSRQDAIDRLLESTRRFKSSESLLDNASSRDDKHRETKVDEKPDSYKYSSVVKDRNDKTDVLRRDDKDAGALKPTDTRYGSDKIGSTGEKDRYQPRSSRDPSSDDKPRHPDVRDTRATRDEVITREEQIRKYTETSNYETPYTSLDHSYQPTHYTSGLPGENFDTGRIYSQPLKPGESPDRRHPNFSHPDSRRPNKIYDKLTRGVDQGDKPKQEPGHPGSSVPDKRRGSTEGILDEPLYDHLNRRPQAPGSPVPMSDRYSLPLDEYDKPIAVHGRPKDPSRPDETGDKSIVSRRPDMRDYGISDFKTERGNVTETTRTSVTQRTFMSRDGEVIKDETSHLENVHHSGQNAIEGSERRESNPDIPTRIQRYPALKGDDVPKDRNTSSTEYTKTTEEETTSYDKTRDERRDVPKDSKLDEILRMAGMKDTGGTTKYQEQTRKDEITRVGDDSNIRTRVHRTDVNTNVNIVKEIVKEKPKESKPRSGIAGLRSKIEALTKSVDELMTYKHKTILKSYVQEHGERRPSGDILALPKPENYEVKSKRYEPNIKLDEVDYVHKEVEIPDSPQKPEISHSELNIEKMWMTEDQGTDIGLRIPKQINLISDDKQRDWWNAPTAEEADRFLCIGDWQWWNANTTEGVDNILGIRAINKETGEAGAIIAKYQGEEKPIEWAWFQATQQPNLDQRRRTLTRVLTVDKDKTDGNEWWDAPTAEDADKYLSMGHYKWWDQNTEEGVDKVLGVRGSTEETGTVLATYRDGTKPTAWTWVQTPDEPERPDDKTHVIRRSSRDLYIDETRPDNVELLIRVKDEETTTHQQPRYVAVRPGPVEKAIIIREIRKGELPQLQNDNEVVIEGTEGEGLQIQDGVIKMRFKDMTPEERKAWVHIMGIERKGFKIDENEVLEIPVRVVDRPKTPIQEVPLYAVPMKKNKNKKSTEIDGKPKPKEKKETASEKKKKQKETDAERNKRELKAKKLEEEKKKQIEKESLKKKKSVDKEKKKELESQKKKKETDTQKKKRELESIKKKKELEKVKERESKSKKEKKEKQTKRSSSVSSSNEKIADAPPTVDRSLKPKLSNSKDVIHETHVHQTSNVRRTSTDDVDSGTNFQHGGSKHLSYVEVNAVHHGGAKGANTKAVTQVGGSTYSPTRKPGPFAISNKEGSGDRPQSARGRMTTHTETHNVRTVFEDKATPTKRQSPSVKVVKRVNISQKTQPGTGKTEVVKTKSGNVQRQNSGGQIVVPLRGRSTKHDGNVQVVTSHQRAQSQKVPGQHIRQTRVEKTYRTETKVVNPNDGSNVISVQKSAPLPLDRSISDSQTTVIRHDSGGTFNSVPLRRGSGHSVTNVSVKSRSTDGQPNVVQMTRRSSNEKTAPLKRQGSSSSHSVTNVSVSSHSVDGQPNVVRRSSGDAVISAPLERRRSSGHSVTNVSVSSRSADGQNNAHEIRRSSGDAVNSAPLERRRSSGHSVTNVSVSSRSADGQNTAHKVRRSSEDAAPLERRGSSSHSDTNVSVSSRSADGQNTVHKVRRSSRDAANAAPLERRGSSSHSVTNVSVSSRQSSSDPVPLDRQGSTRSVTNVSVDGVPLNRHGSEFHSVEHHSSSGHSNVGRMARRPSGDPWKVDISERQGGSENHSRSNVSVVHTVTSSGQQATGFPPPPNMAMSSGQHAAGFPPPPNMLMASGQQGVGFPPLPNMAMSSGQHAAGFSPPPNMAMSSRQQAGFPPPPNMAMSSGQQFTVIQDKGSVKSYSPSEVHAVVQLQNQPTESSTDLSYYTEGRQAPHGYVQREVRHERRTQWSVENAPTKDHHI